MEISRNYNTDKIYPRNIYFTKWILIILSLLIIGFKSYFIKVKTSPIFFISVISFIFLTIYQYLNLMMVLSLIFLLTLILSLFSFNKDEKFIIPSIIFIGFMILFYNSLSYTKETIEIINDQTNKDYLSNTEELKRKITEKINSSILGRENIEKLKYKYEESKEKNLLSRFDNNNRAGAQQQAGGAQQQAGGAQQQAGGGGRGAGGGGRGAGGGGRGAGGGGAGGGGRGAGGGGAGGGAVNNPPSDRRLKTNINLICKSPSGFNIYSFEYIDKSFGLGKWQGVMSDEIPSFAVIKHSDGFDRVDYSQLDVEFKQI